MTDADPRRALQLEKTFTFEAAHRLPHVPEGHKCARLHGHSFRVTVTVTGPLDDKRGWIVDFAALKEAWAPLHDVLDHHYLNEVEGLENPTSENLAHWVADRYRVDGANLAEVRVSETCNSACVLKLG